MAQTSEQSLSSAVSAPLVLRSCNGKPVDGLSPLRHALKRDLTGRRFGRLVAVRPIGVRGKNVMWEVRCDCGSSAAAPSYHLADGGTRSCGCLTLEARQTTIRMLRERQLKHGQAFKRPRTPEYMAWVSMWQRVRSKPGDHDYEKYAGRGITCCERWRSSKAFLTDMGPRPTGDFYSLDRIDNDGNYEPHNCRWATAAQQNANRRKPRPRRQKTAQVAS